MAIPLPSAALLFLLLLLTSGAGAFNSSDIEELTSALAQLRSHGYSLFTNAVTTSDLQYALLSTPSSSFTVFAPKDEMLFALDMATDAAHYVNTLRYHVVPHRRHTSADLRNLSSPFLDTLLPHYAILVGVVQDDDVLADRPTVSVMVDGVRLDSPDLFLGSRIAVHGIDGILLSGLNITQDSDILPTAPAEEMFPSNSAPAPAPATTTHRFDWGNVDASPNKVQDDQMEKLLAKKGRRKGRRRHHQRRRQRGHQLNEL